MGLEEDDSQEQSCEFSNAKCKTKNG